METKGIDLATVKDKIIYYEVFCGGSLNLDKTKQEGVNIKVTNVRISWRKRIIRADVAFVDATGPRRVKDVKYPLDMFLKEGYK